MTSDDGSGEASSIPDASLPSPELPPCPVCHDPITERDAPVWVWWHAQTLEYELEMPVCGFCFYTLRNEREDGP